MSHGSSGREEQQEQAEWEGINRLLQHHGFKPIQLADPMENKNLSDVVLLDKKSAAEIKLMLKSLVKDTERRQALIQELIQSNNQLKDEVQQQEARAARQSQRASDLERILDGVKTKIQDLEDDYIAKAAQQQNQMKRLQTDKKDSQKRYRLLEQKVGKEKEVISQLQKRLECVVNEEENRTTRQNKVFQQFCKRGAKESSVLDQQLLDVIDAYETKIQHLQTELRKYKGDTDESSQEELPVRRKRQDKNEVLDATPNYKALLKSYQDQLKESKAQKEQMRQEHVKLKQELESRPTAKELKSCKQQLKRMDRLIQQGNITTAEHGNNENDEGADRTEVEHIDCLHANICRRFLKSICKELNVQDLNDLVPAARVRAKEAEANPKLVKVLSAIKTVVSNQRAPLLQSQSDTVEEQGYELLLPTIEMWAEQLVSLKDLQCVLKKLMLRLVPWHSFGTHDPSSGVRVEHLLLMVDILLKETETKDKEVKKPSQQTLQAIVSHFQKLFDVNSISGVYPRMSEVYSKLGEMSNAMRNLRDLMGLDDSTPPSALVNMVGKLCCSINDGTSQQVQQLLGTQDIESIINRLEEHEEFFPAFQALIQELLQILDVNHLDDVLSTVRSLKLLAE
ncbi:centrosomal protein of 70 kDa isoform X2 [Acipenser oxyrinchus oxyrinchus]|uniref:Centrosomal protein of 70 kDa n=1 Tax=Acipenser oxyrinchus oxyrinchus TaxID=40147 RepID=A0AAD8D8V3_ACIOX|nr:centrosomal protein of 70 kDa isoform X2 [Acipenser oxyrinchus oxyrinchus]